MLVSTHGKQQGCPHGSPSCCQRHSLNYEWRRKKEEKKKRKSVWLYNRTGVGWGVLWRNWLTDINVIFSFYPPAGNGRLLCNRKQTCQLLRLWKHYLAERKEGTYLNEVDCWHLEKEGKKVKNRNGLKNVHIKKMARKPL